jgi:hypothetical protein
MHLIVDFVAQAILKDRHPDMLLRVGSQGQPRPQDWTEYTQETCKHAGKCMHIFCAALVADW